jgi:predicted Rossmann-fold nucleotide-binding protein
MFTRIPFSPIRETLYSPQQLMAGLDAGDYRSFACTPDFKCFAYYVRHGRSAPKDPLSSIYESLHDSSITQATLAYLKREKKVGAVMGGHDEPRDSDTYAAVARMARALSRKGFLMTSGGGPGAMEATHLGALLQNEADGALGAALSKLKGQKALPADAGKVITPAGKIDDKILRALHAWIMPAFALGTGVKRPGESLAVPTWYYGHEPTTPFATKIGKYFQNSLREDGLITIAAHGIIFAPGKAGTLQEIFQDAVRNYYRAAPNPFSPMVFYDKTYWTQKLPAAGLLEKLFTRNNRGPDYKKYVLVTSDEQEAIDFLVSNAPPPNSHLRRLKSLGLLS